jgi:hypothetical protein
LALPRTSGDIPAAYTKAAIESDSDNYMYPPNGMVLTEDERIAGGPTPVLKLLRSLYGLKQAGCLWNNLLRAQLIDIGYTRCKTDLCLYFRRKERDIAIVGVYVDDLLATATSPQLVKDLFTSLQALEVKDLGVVRKFSACVSNSNPTVSPWTKKRLCASTSKHIPWPTQTP